MHPCKINLRKTNACATEIHPNSFKLRLTGMPRGQQKRENPFQGSVALLDTKGKHAHQTPNVIFPQTRLEAKTFFLSWDPGQWLMELGGSSVIVRRLSEARVESFPHALIHSSLLQRLRVIRRHYFACSGTEMYPMSFDMASLEARCRSALNGFLENTINQMMNLHWDCLCHTKRVLLVVEHDVYTEDCSKQILLTL